MYFADSFSYFQSVEVVEPGMLSFGSFRGRFACLSILIKKLLYLPLALLCKSCKTFFRLLAAVLGGGLLIFTVGISVKAREFFVRRWVALSKDLIDWTLFPLAVLTCLVRLLLSCTVHPALYLRG